jgi:hypothetical protein
MCIYAHFDCGVDPTNNQTYHHQNRSNSNHSSVNNQLISLQNHVRDEIPQNRVTVVSSSSIEVRMVLIDPVGTI